MAKAKEPRDQNRWLKLASFSALLYIIHHWLA